MEAHSILKAKMHHADFLFPNPTQIEIYFIEPTKVLQNILSEALLTRTNPWVFFALKQLDQDKTTSNDSLDALVLPFMSPYHSATQGLGRRGGGNVGRGTSQSQSSL